MKIDVFKRKGATPKTGFESDRISGTWKDEKVQSIIRSWVVEVKLM